MLWAGIPLHHLVLDGQIFQIVIPDDFLPIFRCTTQLMLTSVHGLIAESFFTGIELPACVYGYADNL